MKKSSMKIVMDGQPTVIEKSGFGFYISNLEKHLKKIDKNIEIELLCPNSKKDLSTLERIVWDLIVFPWKAAFAQGNIIHKPCFAPPLFSFKKVVVTAHDLIPIIFPENLSFFSRFYYTKIMPFCIKRAKVIITISECSKNDLIKYLGISEKKITVIPEAASDHFVPVKDERAIETMKKKYGISKDYILSVSTIEPRKNMAFLVEVFAKLLKENPKLDFQLVLAGKKGWGFEKIEQIIRNNGLNDEVVFTGYVDNEDMPALYSGATLFAFPSLYEGFGLPPLEAMACGTPVICSNSSSLPEVCGEAAILLDPKDREGWVLNLNKLLSDEKLRLQYSNLAIKQSSKFSWEKTASLTLEVYKSL